MMIKGLDLKVLYTLLIAISGIVITIGAASAVMQYTENIELDNGSGDSSIKVTSATGDSKVIVEDQGIRGWSLQASDKQWKFDIVDEVNGKPRITIRHNGLVGINNLWPMEQLDVRGNIHTTDNVDVDGNLNVDGDITGSYIAALETQIASLEATISDQESRIAALEASMSNNEPKIISNEEMIATHDIMISDNAAGIAANAADIAAIETGGEPNPCDPNADGVIDAVELQDYMLSLGANWSLESTQSKIDQTENAVGSTQTNGVFDTIEEVNYFNNETLGSLGYCPPP